MWNACALSQASIFKLNKDPGCRRVGNTNITTGIRSSDIHKLPPCNIDMIHFQLVSTNPIATLIYSNVNRLNPL